MKRIIENGYPGEGNPKEMSPPLDFTMLSRAKQAELLRLAIRLAVYHHAEQTDKSGKPYVGHVTRVGSDALKFSVFTCIVGFLHDIIEDCDVTAEDLLAMGLPDFIVEAVVAITHLPNEPHVDYMKRVMVNGLARRAKLCDFRDNASPDRWVGDGRDDVRNARYCQGIRDILALDGEFMSPDDVAYFEEPIVAHYPH